MSSPSEEPAAACSVCFAENEAVAGSGRWRQGEGGVDPAVTVVFGTPMCAVHASAIITALAVLLDGSNRFYIFDDYRAVDRFERHEREQNAPRGVQLR